MDRALGEYGRGDRARTRDLRFWRPSLYQLSYTPARVLLYRVAIDLAIRTKVPLPGAEDPRSELAERTDRSVAAQEVGPAIQMPNDQVVPFRDAR